MPDTKAGGGGSVRRGGKIGKKKKGINSEQKIASGVAIGSAAGLHSVLRPHGVYGTSQGGPGTEKERSEGRGGRSRKRLRGGIRAADVLDAGGMEHSAASWERAPPSRKERREET